MAVIDLTTPLALGNNAGFLPNRPNQMWEGPPSRLRRRVFFVGAPDWTSSTTGGSLTPAADVVRTVAIDQGVLIEGVWLNVLTAGPAGSTVNVGDATFGATTYFTAQAVSATGAFFSATSNKWYTNAADYLLVTMGTTVPTGALLEVGFVGTSILPYTNE